MYIKILFVACILSSKSHNFDWPLASIHKVFVYVGLVVIILCSFVSVSLFTKSRVKWTFAIYLPLGINRKSPLTLLNFLCLSVRAESNSKKIVKSLCPFSFLFFIVAQKTAPLLFWLFGVSLPQQSKKDSLFFCEKRQPRTIKSMQRICRAKQNKYHRRIYRPSNNGNKWQPPRVSKTYCRCKQKRIWTNTRL